VLSFSISNSFCLATQNHWTKTDVPSDHHFISFKWLILTWTYKRLDIYLLLSLWSELRCRLYFKIGMKNPTIFRHNFISLNFLGKKIDRAWTLLIMYKKIIFEFFYKFVIYFINIFNSEMQNFNCVYTFESLLSIQ